MKFANKKNKKHLSHRAVIAVTMLIAAAGVLTAFILYNRLSYTDVKLNDMLQVAYSGYNGKGEAGVTVRSPVQYSDFMKTVKAVPDRDDNLSNGDSVNITWNYDEKLAKEQNLRVDAEPAVYTVSGLVDPKVVTREELFKNAKVTETGISPYITLQVENTSDDSFLKTVKFTVANSKDFYAAGDSYTLEADYSSSEALKECYEIGDTDTGLQQEYKIETNEAYLSKASDLSDNELQQLNKTAAALLTDVKAREYGLRIFREMNLMPVWKGTTTTFRWESPSLISAYFDLRKSDSPNNRILKHINDVKLIYNAVLTQDDGTSCNAEVIVRFTDIVKNGESNDLNLSSGTIISASAKNANIKELISNDAEDYEVQNISLK